MSFSLLTWLVGVDLGVGHNVNSFAIAFKCFTAFIFVSIKCKRRQLAHKSFLARISRRYAIISDRTDRQILLRYSTFDTAIMQMLQQ